MPNLHQYIVVGASPDGTQFILSVKDGMNRLPISRYWRISGNLLVLGDKKLWGFSFDPAIEPQAQIPFKNIIYFDPPVGNITVVLSNGDYKVVREITATLAEERRKRRHSAHLLAH